MSLQKHPQRYEYLTSDVQYIYNQNNCQYLTLKTHGSWGSEGSCYSDSASRVRVGSLLKQTVVGVVRVVAIQNFL